MYNLSLLLVERTFYFISLWGEQVALLSSECVVMQQEQDHRKPENGKCLQIPTRAAKIERTNESKESFRSF